MKTRLVVSILIALILFAGGALGASVGNGATDEKGLIPYVWWKFDGDTTEHGSFATEDAIEGTYVASQGGFALKHTGKGWGSGIRTEDDWGDWTLTVVAKVTSVDNGIIFGLGSRNSMDGTKTRGIALASGGADKVTVSPFFGTAEHSDLIEAEVENASDAYHFYAVTFVGSSKTVALYVDGELKRSAQLESEVNPVEGHWQFGSINGNVNNTGLSEQKNQFFDDVRFYRTALTDEQIAAIAAAFPAWTGAKTIAAGETWTLEKNESLATLSVGAGATIDLNGYDLRIGSVPDNSFSADKLYIVTNSNDETTGTVTLGVGNGTLGFNKNAILGGNLRYVMVGTDQTHFRQNDQKRDDALVANTHTGGTVLNTTSEIRFYTPDSFGSGDIVFGNGAYLFKPSSNASGGTVGNNIRVEATEDPAKLNIDGQTYSFNGTLSGDGTLEVGYGHTPTVNNNMNLSGFGGILYWNMGSRGESWRGPDVGMGTGGGSLKLGNNTSIKLKPMNGGNESKPDVIEYGMLSTESDDPEVDNAGTKITTQISYKTVILRVGSSGASGTYAGSIAEETANSCKFAIEKVGGGVWTLNGASIAHRGDTTVRAGRLNVDTSGWGTSKVTVENGATLGGTGTLSTATTVKTGGILAGPLKLTGGVTFEDGAVIYGDAAATITGDVDLAGTVVEVDDVDAVTDGQVFLTVNGTATGKPSVSAALAAVEKYDGKNGKWGVKATTANGVTTFSLVWKPMAFMVIIR